MRGLAADGVREVTLLGQNVNSYGRDLRQQGNPSFAELLRAIDAVEGIDRIRYTSPHPKDMKEDVIAAHAECASVCEHIHLPLQSGSSRILKAMRRTYDRSRYLDRVALIREHVPDAAITTDIIVGFPGETEADFAETLEVAEEVGYDGAFTFVFSPRRGTEAATLDGMVPHPGQEGAHGRASSRSCSGAPGSARSASSGASLDVLVEGPSRTDPTRLRGRSRHNKAVNFEGTAAPGELVDVQVESAHLDDPPRLRGPALPRPLSPCPRRGASSRSSGRPASARRRSRSSWPALLRERGEDPVAVSCDAIQVYRGLEVLSGAADASERSSAGASAGRDRRDRRGVQRRPLRRARPRRDRRADRRAGRTPIVVGGTGLYMRAALADLDLQPPVPDEVRALVEAQMPELGPAALHAELDPDVGERIHPNDRKRVARALELQRAGLDPPERGTELWTARLRHPTALLGIVVDREALADRIDRRVDAMAAAGAAEEARAARAAGASRTAASALGFEDLLTGDLDAVKADHRRYARRQMTWLRKMEGVEVIDRTDHRRP